MWRWQPFQGEAVLYETARTETGQCYTSPRVNGGLLLAASKQIIRRYSPMVSGSGKPSTEMIKDAGSVLKVMREGLTSANEMTVSLAEGSCC